MTKFEEKEREREYTALQKREPKTKKSCKLPNQNTRDLPPLPLSPTTRGKDNYTHFLKHL